MMAVSRLALFKCATVDVVCVSSSSAGGYTVVCRERRCGGRARAAGLRGAVCAPSSPHPSRDDGAAVVDALAGTVVV